MCAPQDLVVLPSATNLAVALALSLPRCVTSTRGPISLLKARKNETEVHGFRNCHVRDGVALVRYFSWLERELKKGEKQWKEYEAALQLEEFRKCVLSFPKWSTCKDQGMLTPFADAVSASQATGPLPRTLVQHHLLDRRKRLRHSLCSAGGRTERCDRHQ